MEIKDYTLPEELYYEPNHYWVKVEGDLLVMGMNDFAQKMAGEVVFVQLPFEGKKLKAGKKFSQVESGKWLGKVYAPVNGKIAVSNQELEVNPGLINEDCYGKGWMFKIQPNDMGELENLIHGPDAIESWMLEEIEKFVKE
ncbi:glycine cleavage system H protein [Desulfocicer vacuolatum DSM 3385]|uniref:Glycine cleavage system H protein n=1 Tax=Desulfocicer vacuolatum DSM 3385 TaxID=1121400 RepID=A0A1W2D670_9BACT|nr:glycine cleavage system protein GcvH [Desulfocicer vacuolatum]SMC92674.1 glycine cleavage system H protein [Desulfocicer vacuolatum DSM 3385]